MSRFVGCWVRKVAECALGWEVWGSKLCLSFRSMCRDSAGLLLLSQLLLLTQPGCLFAERVYLDVW